MRMYARAPLGAALAGVALAGALLDPAAARPSAAPAPSVAPALPRHPAAMSPAPSAKACTASRDVSIGAGVTARLTLGPSGPAVTFEDGPGRPIPGLGGLDRKHPALPASAGISAEILTPYGPAPRLRTKVEGGPQAPYQVADFPGLPKNCAKAAAR
ncbi:hypothetical protein GCM10010331_51200 [Streptomyces xanthochromogenes]|uniref:hypothetical protein n=1 Tax=Streptomyces TaxID=1883 RepID=UPI0014220F72|nr:MULTISPECIES: hypothetical protein [Streptomyces]GHB57301.1 hypothetical protein GCM10010331_51200 [Streptomyces xanthochromogenes]